MRRSSPTPAVFAMTAADFRSTGRNIDLVYNRVTDFALDRPEHKALREAYRDGAVVVTPNPHNHALLADKRNLTLLSDPVTLEDLGVEPRVRAHLSAVVPRTLLVTPAAADALWKSRKNLFFKPTGGHGGKAVYRGDKVTKGVWAKIAEGWLCCPDFGPTERAHDQGRRRSPDAQIGCPALYL